MSLFSKSLDALEELDLQSLIAAQVPLKSSSTEIEQEPQKPSNIHALYYIVLYTTLLLLVTLLTFWHYSNNYQID